MYKDNFDVERLRKDLEEDSMGAYFVGGFGGALAQASDIKNASDEELIHMAQRQGIHLNRYAR